MSVASITDLRSRIEARPNLARNSSTGKSTASVTPAGGRAEPGGGQTGSPARRAPAEGTVKITVTGRHMDMSEVLKKYALGKSERLTHYFEHLTRAEVLFEPEKDGQYSAELILHAPKG